MSIFSKIAKKSPKRSTFSMPNLNLLSCKIGQLVPFFWEETVPKDLWRVRSEILAKFAPMTAPIMSQVDIYTWFFYVPYRLIWENAEDFFTGGRLGNSVVNYPSWSVKLSDFDGPYKNLFAPGSLYDYLGGQQPQSVIRPEYEDYYVKFSKLPFRAYYKIINDYFLDINLQQPLPEAMSDGDTIFNSTLIRYFEIQNKLYNKDYFTSALPWAQRGGAVTVPLEGDLDVFLKDGVQNQLYEVNDGSGTPIPNSDVTSGSSGQINGIINPNGSLYADLSSANAGLNIETLRYSNALQRWLENNARYGSRYIEQLLARFGVVSSDARLQRSQLVGGGKQTVLISEIMQTSQSTADSPQGNRSGDANSYGQHRLFKDLFCEERGIFMGILCVVPKALYSQGLPKKMQRFSRFEHFYPEFQLLGEQPIKKSELFMTGVPTYDDSTFGYTPRYADYKTRLNEIHGDFKDTLDFFHMGRIFAQSDGAGGAPVLNENFLKIRSSDFDRVFAVQDGDEGFDKVWLQIYTHVKAKRPMIYNPSPSL